MKRSVITDPADPEQFDLDYIAACLQRGGTGAGPRPTGFSLERLGADNSTAYRVRLTYEGAEAGEPASLFLKLCGGGTFGRSEVDYYTKDYAGQSGVPIPKCYDAGYEDRSYHLLLEDLTDTHRNNWEVEPTPAYGKAAARALARLHSLCWGADRLAALGYEVVDERQLHRYAAEARKGFEPLLEAIRDGIDPSYAVAASDVFERHPDAMAGRLAAGDSFALVHGDANPGNILTPRDGSTGDIYFIDRQPFDWSLTSWVGPSDLSYMMVLWWEPERRRALELDVLREYHRSLVAFGVEDYSWERTLSDYRLSALQCFYVAASWCVDPNERANMRWLWSAQLERAVTFYRDWGCNESY
ncbi:phosphotransferase [Paenibacillus sp.]|uniref:phosphotransferase n=1 Tax=Paenibacillus sp. TaxID=58172 RepID=UPI002D56E06A|nr:phosphotransferase [Paenibacillus sp.]HZG57432.1 phosphotransferase [Paenibacillus sp.]